MRLLREIDAAGASCDYLYARIRCRRALLASSGHVSQDYSVQGGSDPHQALRSEHIRVYTQMGQALRQKLLPFFEYSEIHNLIIALRYLAAGDPAALNSQLHFSLLHPRLSKTLRAAERVSPLVFNLERLLADNYPFISGLTQTYLQQGPGGLEQTLLGGYLQAAVAKSRCQPLKTMLIYLLDMRNLLALYKHLHWQVPSPPPLLTGGELNLTDCQKIWGARNLPALLEMMRKRARQPWDPQAQGVEEFLFQGLTAQLRQAGRDPLQPGLVLDYLWRCQLSVRQQGLHPSSKPAPGFNQAMKQEAVG
jgi:hypothetical protein